MSEIQAQVSNLHVKIAIVHFIILFIKELHIKKNDLCSIINSLEGSYYKKKK